MNTVVDGAEVGARVVAARDVRPVPVMLIVVAAVAALILVLSVLS